MSSIKSENYEEYRAELFKRFFDTDSYFFLCLSTSLQNISSKRADFKEDDYFVIGKVIQVLVDSDEPARTLEQFHELSGFKQYMYKLDDGLVHLQLPDLEKQDIQQTIEGLAEEFVTTFAEIIRAKPACKQLLKMLGVPPRKKVVAQSAQAAFLSETEDATAEAANGAVEERPASRDAQISTTFDESELAPALQDDLMNGDMATFENAFESDLEANYMAEGSTETPSDKESDAHLDTQEFPEPAISASKETPSNGTSRQASFEQAGQSARPLKKANWQDILDDISSPRSTADLLSKKVDERLETFHANNRRPAFSADQTAMMTKRMPQAANKDERIAEFRSEADLYFRVIDEAIEQLILNKQSRIAFENLELAAYSLKSVARKLGLEQLAKLPEQVEELIGKIVLLRVAPGNSAYVTIKRTFAMIKNIRSQRDMEHSEYRELSNSLLRLTRSMDELQQTSRPANKRSNPLRKQIQQNIDTFRLAEMSA